MSKFVQFSPKYCPEAKDTHCTEWDTSHDLSMLTDEGERVRIGTFKHAAWAERVGQLLARHGFDDEEMK